MSAVETPQARGRAMLKANGYGAHPESADPGYVGKFKNGGGVKGKAHEPRPDRRARGGPVGAGKGHGKHPTVAITVKTGGGQAEKAQAAQQGMQMGAALGARAAAQKMAAMPPPGARPMMPPSGAPPMPPGGPPMGGPPRPPMAGGPPGMGARHGGAIRRASNGRFKGGAV